MRMCSTDKMAASSGSGQQILALRIKECEHGSEKKLMSSLDGQSTLNDDNIFLSSKILPFAESLCTLTGTIADSQCKD